MLERCFVRPDTLDRIRSSWLGPPIERYAAWLCERGYRVRTLATRVSILRQFGTFAQKRGTAWRWAIHERNPVPAAILFGAH
jgi:integrase/recombinase XerD